MDQYYDDFFESAQKATDNGRFLKLPRYQEKLKYNFDGLYSYRTKIAHLDLPTRTRTNNYNYTRRFLEDHYGFQASVSN